MRLPGVIIASFSPFFYLRGGGGEKGVALFCMMGSDTAVVQKCYMSLSVGAKQLIVALSTVYDIVYLWYSSSVFCQACGCGYSLNFDQ